MAPDGNTGDGLLVQLTAAVTSIVTIAGLFVLTGVIGRVQRNYPFGFALAIGVAVAGSAFIALRPLLKGILGELEFRGSWG